MNDTKSDQPISFDFKEWEKEQQARDDALKAILPKNKTTLFAFLSKRGITRVVVEFDGYGDSGSIDGVEAMRGDKPADLPTETIPILTIPWRQLEPAETPVNAQAMIEHMAYELLGQTHGGWENDAGAFGTFIFDVATATISLKFNQRFEDAYLFEHTF